MLPGLLSGEHRRGGVWLGAVAVMSERDLRLDALDRRCVLLVLSWYRHLRVGLLSDEEQAKVDVLLDPPIARISHIGSQMGRPSNPTMSRGIKLASMDLRDDKDRLIVKTVDDWVLALTSRQRVIVRMLYGIDVAPEGYTLAEVGSKVALKARAVEYEVNGALLALALRLRPVMPYLRDLCQMRRASAAPI